MSRTVLSIVPYARQVLNKYSLFHPVARDPSRYKSVVTLQPSILQWLPSTTGINDKVLSMSRRSGPRSSLPPPFGSRKTPNMPSAWDLLHGCLPPFPQISGHVSPSHGTFPTTLFKIAPLTILILCFPLPNSTQLYQACIYLSPD